MQDLSTAVPESVAAVDLGSNSFHLIVARVSSGEPVVVDRLREMVQLASGLDASKRLSEKARNRGLDCLRRFGERLRSMPVDSVRAVGTNTLRVAHAQYHRHGEYIIAASDLPGFSREEQKLLATLVRAHRRKFPAAVLKALPRKRGREVERLAILLRVAALMHRSRAPDATPEPELTVGKKSLSLKFPEGWMEEHPLTLADLRQEARYLESAGYRLVSE